MSLTYQDLIELGRAQSEDRQQYVNRRSGLAGRSGYLPHLGLTQESPIGRELFNEPQIESWLKHKAASTARASRTYLRWWQTTYVKLLQAQGLPGDPRERTQRAINEGVQRLGISKRQLALKAGLSPNTVTNWANGNRYPTSRIQVTKLEQALELPVGTLSNHLHREIRDDAFCPRSRLPEEIQRSNALLSRMRWRLPSDFPALPPQEQDSLIARHAAEILDDVYRHRRAAQDHPYSLPREDFPDRLQREVGDFFAYKTRPVLPNHQQRHGRGRLRREASRRLWEENLGMFFGWYVLPSEEQYRTEHGRSPQSQMLIGAGGATEELTLGLLAVPSLVEDYVTWRMTVRSKAPTHASVVMIQQLKSLVHPDTGYLTQHLELIHRIPERYQQPYYSRHERYLKAAAEEQSALMQELEKARQRGELRRAS